SSALLSPLSTTVALPPSFPTRRSSDLPRGGALKRNGHAGASASSSHEDRKDAVDQARVPGNTACRAASPPRNVRGGSQRVCNKRSEEHTSELQSPDHLVCRLLLEKKKR